MSVKGTECRSRGQSVGQEDRVSVDGTECQEITQRMPHTVLLTEHTNDATSSFYLLYFLLGL